MEPWPNSIRVLMRRDARDHIHAAHSLSLPCWGHNHKTALCRKRALARNWISQHPNLGLLASRTVERKHLLFKPPVCNIWLWWLKLTKTGQLWSNPFYKREHEALNGDSLAQSHTLGSRRTAFKPGQCASTTFPSKLHSTGESSATVSEC